MPISRMTWLVEPLSGKTCEASPDRPIAAATADIASRTGTPAAMIAPNATSRMSSVTGRLRNSARSKSEPSCSLTPSLIDWPPTCSTRTPGWSAWIAAVWSSSGRNRSSAVSRSPLIVTGTSTAEPSGAVTGSPTSPTSGSAPMRCATSRPAAVASATSSGPANEVMSTFSLAGSSK